MNKYSNEALDKILDAQEKSNRERKKIDKHLEEDKQGQVEEEIEDILTDMSKKIQYKKNKRFLFWK